MRNIEGREKLLEEISQRMAATNNTMVWKLKYALDKAEFARIPYVEPPEPE